MNIHIVASSVLASVLSAGVFGQQALQGTGKVGQLDRVSADAAAFKQGLMHRVALEEAAIRRAESGHAANADLNKTYVQLGLLYQDLGQWERSETALEHAVSLLRYPAGSSEDLAATISQLGNLHALMGKFGEGEKEQLEALKTRQDLGDRLQIARSWNSLAALYLAKQKFAKARDFAQQALAEFVVNGQADALDRISSRFALSEALCSIEECPSAVPLLKAALDEAKTMLGPNDFPIGMANFVLGYAYWKSGDMSRAKEYMEQGTARMSEQLGWGHPAYLRALRCYSKFLHETKNVEAANVVERRIRQSEAVIDVHSMQTSQGMFGFVGPR
jgi:tetratricopeptide (TPR) repeat protein